MQNALQPNVCLPVGILCQDVTFTPATHVKNIH